MRTLSKKIIAIAFIYIGITNVVLGATGMGGQGDEPCGGPFDPCPVPLDGGVSLLLAAGAMYGGKKIYETFKKVKE